MIMIAIHYDKNYDIKVNECCEFHQDFFYSFQCKLFYKNVYGFQMFASLSSFAFAMAISPVRDTLKI